MKKENFTTDRVAKFKCITGKAQSIFWDAKTPGLGLRVTAAGSKAYIFETSLNGKTLRITIGSPQTWTLDAAQKEACELKGMTDKGRDPRQVKADILAAEQALRDSKKAEQTAIQIKNARESVTLAAVWPEYIAERSPVWSEHHILDHEKMIQAGGTKRTRSPKLTEPGPLASLAGVRLVDLTVTRIEAWARVEAATRPTRARLALRLLKACLFWCAANPAYADFITNNPAKSKKARESLGKANVKNDVLQREQLRPWFAAVGQLGNPVISGYLQALLITGARREELAHLKWIDVDFQWSSMTIRDKIEGMRVIPLTPYVAQLLAALPRRNEWVFSSPSAEAGRLAEPRIAHVKALTVAGLPHVSLHGLRRSFASLCEWTETPAGIAAQIQGHAPQGVREQNYIRRPLDLLRMWHVKIEAWILEQAGIDFVPVQAGLRIVAA
jgi:integrase